MLNIASEMQLIWDMMNKSFDFVEIYAKGQEM